MKARAVTSEATPKNLVELLGIPDGDRGTKHVKLDTLAAVTWGDKDQQPMTIDGRVLPNTSLKSLYLLGAGTVNVAWW
jgi:hypothetical protein